MKILETASNGSAYQSPAQCNEGKTGANGQHLMGKLALAGAGIGLGLAAYSYFFEPLNVQLERLTVRLAHTNGKIPAEGLRILHLSDTHFQGKDRREHAKIERIRRLVSGLECDLIVHTGDFLHFDSGIDNVMRLLDVLPRPRLGSYAVLGNHDYTHYAMGEAIPSMWRVYQQEIGHRRNGRRLSPFGASRHLFGFGRFMRNTPIEVRRTGCNDTDRLTAVLESRGVRVLHNESTHLCCNPGRPNGVDLYLCGVDDVVEGRPRIHHALDAVPANAPTVLLSHNPDIVESQRIDQVDLLLSGHTHGGQIVLPFWGPAGTQVEFLARENVAGYFRHGHTQVYITRGLGEGIPLRFGARPQLALITVRP